MKSTITLILVSFIYLATFAQPISYGHSIITTSGEAIVYAAPDQIVFSFSFSQIADTSPEAREGLSKQYNSALSAMNSFNIAKEHIQTQYMNVGVHYPERRGSDKGPKKIQASQNYRSLPSQYG